MELLNYALVDKKTKKVINIITWDNQSFLDPNIQLNYDLILLNGDVKDFPISLDHVYDETYKIFIPPKPNEYPSWIFDFDKIKWIPPIPRPTDSGLLYLWDESIKNWTEFFAESPIINTNEKTPNELLQDLINNLEIST